MHIHEGKHALWIAAGVLVDFADAILFCVLFVDQVCTCFCTCKPLENLALNAALPHLPLHFILPSARHKTCLTGVLEISDFRMHSQSRNTQEISTKYQFFI